MTKDLLVVIRIATIVGDPDTTPMSVRLPTRKEKILQNGEVEEMNHLEEREGSRDDRYEQRPSRRSKDSERKDKSSRSYTRRRHQAHVGEWVSGSDSDNYSERSYQSNLEDTQDEGCWNFSCVNQLLRHI